MTDTPLILRLAEDGRSLNTPIGDLPAQHGKGGIRADKREGDGATPVGIFPLRQMFWRADKLGDDLPCGLPSRAITPADGWCDDADHAAYNQLVQLPFGASYEQMWRDDGLYDIVVVMGHNDDPPMPGLGSAIFLHCAAPDWRGTEGCIVLARDDLQALLPHLTPDTLIEIPPAAAYTPA